MELKQFHIVKIINDSEFIINAGIGDNVVGDKFKIVGHSIDEIIDPITNESLGSLETSKGTIEVKRVFEKMSIASSLSRFVSPFLQPMRDFYKTERVRLNVDLTQVSGSSSNTDDAIRIGDTVVKIEQGSESND